MNCPAITIVCGSLIYRTRVRVSDGARICTVLDMVRSIYCEPHMLNFGEELKKWLYVGVAQFAATIGARVGVYTLHRTREGDCRELFWEPIENVEGVVSYRHKWTASLAGVGEEGVRILYKIVEGDTSQGTDIRNI